MRNAVVGSGPRSVTVDDAAVSGVVPGFRITVNPDTLACIVVRYV